MTYETLDWDAEAKRVARAFGLESDPPFEQSSEQWLNMCVLFFTSRETLPETNAELKVTFRNDGVRFFEIIQHSPYSYSEIKLAFDGTVEFVETNKNEFNFLLAKGLHHLGLLTAEVVAALETTVSGHQKLEWTLEYEARYEL